MTNLLNAAAPLGRALLVSVFLFAGLTKLGAVEGTQGYMETMGVPGMLVFPAIAFEILAPIAVIIGFYARASALLLAGFSVLTAFIFHFDFSDQIQSVMFLKNIALAGGLLLLASFGPGAFSINPTR